MNKIKFPEEYLRQLRGETSRITTASPKVAAEFRANKKKAQKRAEVPGISRKPVSKQEMDAIKAANRAEKERPNDRPLLKATSLADKNQKVTAIAKTGVDPHKPKRGVLSIGAPIEINGRTFRRFEVVPSEREKVRDPENGGRAKSAEWNDSVALELKRELEKLSKERKSDPNIFDRGAMK